MSCESGGNTELLKLIEDQRVLLKVVFKDFGFFWSLVFIQNYIFWDQGFRILLMYFLIVGCYSRKYHVVHKTYYTLVRFKIQKETKWTGVLFINPKTLDSLMYVNLRIKFNLQNNPKILKILVSRNTIHQREKKINK